MQRGITEPARLWRAAWNMYHSSINVKFPETPYIYLFSIYFSFFLCILQRKKYKYIYLYFLSNKSFLISCILAAFWQYTIQHKSDILRIFFCFRRHGGRCNNALGEVFACKNLKTKNRHGSRFLVGGACVRLILLFFYRKKKYFCRISFFTFFYVFYVIKINALHYLSLLNINQKQGTN